LQYTYCHYIIVKPHIVCLYYWRFKNILLYIDEKPTVFLSAANRTEHSAASNGSKTDVFCTDEVRKLTGCLQLKMICRRQETSCFQPLTGTETPARRRSEKV
jgi:hypothetical protein